MRTPWSPPEVFPGVNYFHFALPRHEWDYEKATGYYGAPVAGKEGPFPGFYVLQKWFRRMGGAE